ncbi:copper-binding protein [Pendulispora albinea]|uniref:Copper-binding protein n=1 Tax=Pendulispora albinea TaxID=2741071 RepID=A0ABZ2LMF8_9BACT
MPFLVPTSRTLRALRLIVPVALVGSAATAAYVSRPAVAHACGSETYSARGVVRSFGADKKYVNIAHEKIEGYMAAMTMSFEPRNPQQLAGLNVGDSVSFRFTATEDGRRLLDAIEKK